MCIVYNIFIVKGCPVGWVKLNISCYKVFVARTAGWENAENQCRQEGGHLASIHSTQENDFVTRLDSDVMLLGGTDVDTEGSWHWSDRSTFSFTNWGCGNPDNAGSNEHCMTTNQRCGGQLGIWNDLPCSYFIRKFVCEKHTGMWAKLLNEIITYFIIFLKKYET